MYVSVRHVRYILHHTAGHITHVTLCSSQSRESADQLKLSGGARVQPPAARLSLKMGKPGSSPTNRQYRHVDRQCMDWPLYYEHYADPTESDVRYPAITCCISLS